MKLTQDETQFLEGQINRLETRARRWKYERVLALVCFVFVVVFLIAVDKYFAPRLRRITDLGYSDSRVQKETVDVQTMRSYVSHNVTAVRTEMLFMMRAIIVAAIGVVVFVAATSNWNRHKQHLILAKFLRDLLEQNKEEDTQRVKN